MNTVYFVRHGENKANITKEFSYMKVDYPLTEKGKIQSIQTADYFANKQIDEIYTSPLKKAIGTAEYIEIQTGKKPVVIEEFRELNVGELESIPPDETNWGIYQKVTSEWVSGNTKYSFPNGENGIELLDRFTSGLKKIIKDKTDKKIIVVGHDRLHRLDHICFIIFSIRPVWSVVSLMVSLTNESSSARMLTAA